MEEYKFEGFEMFSRVLIQIKSAAVTSISHQVIESLFGDEDIFDSSNFKIEMGFTIRIEKHSFSEICSYFHELSIFSTTPRKVPGFSINYQNHFI